MLTEYGVCTYCTHVVMGSDEVLFFSFCRGISWVPRAAPGLRFGNEPFQTQTRERPWSVAVAVVNTRLCTYFGTYSVHCTLYSDSFFFVSVRWPVVCRTWLTVNKAMEGGNHCPHVSWPEEGKIEQGQC